MDGSLPPNQSVEFDQWTDWVENQLEDVCQYTDAP